MSAVAVEPALTEAQQYLVDMTKKFFRDVVDDEDAVAVDAKLREYERQGQVLFLSVSVSAADVGKAIGKQGRIADAVRVLVKSAAVKLGAGRVYVEVADDREAT